MKRTGLGPAAARLALFHKDTAVGLLIALAAWAVYLSTLSPSIGQMDAGELAAASSTLGIPHPTGYPLFALLGRAFSLIPLGEARVIWKLNFMASLLAAAAVFVLYRLFLLLLSDPFPGGGWKFARRGKSRPETPSRFNRIAAATGALTLAFSRVYWSNAVSVEVYALHLLFLTLVLLFFMHWARARMEGGANRESRFWALFVYVLGLSFANHMMTVLLAPALLYLYFSVQGLGRAAWVKIAKAAPLFLLALTPYLYLPLRAGVNPRINWGNPARFQEFWYHVTAEQFRFRMFASSEVPWEKLSGFFSSLPSDFGYAPLAFSVLGAVFLLRKEPGLALFSALILSGCLLYAVNYAFYDPEFYLHAHLVVALGAAFGVKALAGFARNAASWALPAAAAAVIALALGMNYQAVSERKNYAVEDYAKNVLLSLDSNAVLFADNFEYLSSPIRYLQGVERVREDVTVLDYELLNFPWYYRSLESRAPWLVESLNREVGRLSRQAAVPGGEPLRSTTLGMLRPEILRDILENGSGKRPVYVSPGIPLGGLSFFSAGLTYGLTPRTPKPASERDFHFRPLPKDNIHARRIKAFYALAYANLGISYEGWGDTLAARDFLQKSLEVQPYFPEARARLDRILSGSPPGRERPSRSNF